MSRLARSLSAFDPNGPLVVTDPDGNHRRVTKGALCRCGYPKTTPFCYGSHKAARFRTE